MQHCTPVCVQEMRLTPQHRTTVRHGCCVTGPYASWTPVAAVYSRPAGRDIATKRLQESGHGVSLRQGLSDHSQGGPAADESCATVRISLLSYAGARYGLKEEGKRRRWRRLSGAVTWFFSR
jgi:hypothetical protein